MSGSLYDGREGVTVIRDGDQGRLLQTAGRELARKLREALAGRERVNLAVPGGRAVARIFQAMVREELDWKRVHVFVVDERLVPPDHPDSNFKLVQEHLVGPLALAGRMPPDNAHPFLLDPECADRGAGRYERELEEQGSRYDVILLSAGEDGHVGALFPRHHSVEDPHHGFIVMDDSPKPPPSRLSSSRSLLQTARAAVLLFFGEAKREAYRMFNDGPGPVTACPAKLVLAIADTTVCTDLSRRGDGQERKDRHDHETV
jgi:6-phosphogluconolactonase